MASVAEIACRHLHAPEWDAPTPRTTPCAGCTDLAEQICASSSATQEPPGTWVRRPEPRCYS